MIAAGLLISWATPLTSWPMALSFSACWSWCSVCFWSVMSRARARTRVTSPRSRTGAYSMALRPFVPSSRRPATSNRCTSPRNAAASRSRTVAAASGSSDANTLRSVPASGEGGAASSRLADSFRSITRPSRSSTAIASGTASITSRRWRSAAAVAASESTSERVWVATSCSSTLA